MFSFLPTVILVLTIAFSAQPAGTHIPHHKVVVCLSFGPELPSTEAVEVEQSAAMASRIFEPTGIDLVWRERGRACDSRQTGIIRVALTLRTKNTDPPNSLAYAFPFEGVHIVVFYYRVRNAAHNRAGRFVPVMGHVLAHEIAHLLEGVDRHSEEGVLKAKWDSRDFARMASGPLLFTPLDIRLIRDGFAHWIQPKRESADGAAN